MDEQNDLLARMQAITVSREYGSGGGEIAKRLAAHLRWQLIDHEIVARVAQMLDVSMDEAEAHDEYTESSLINMLSNMGVIQPAMFAYPPSSILTNPRDYRTALDRVVHAAVAKGHVVIVGRGSQVILKDRRDVLHIRVVAPLEQRIDYVMQRERLSRTDAQERIRLKDCDRDRYLLSQYHSHPNDTSLYDISVNTGTFGLEGALTLILAALEHKAERLTVSTGALGPVTGLPPYPGQPEDLRPPESGH
jgi:cytidylate kinase